MTNPQAQLAAIVGLILVVVATVIGGIVLAAGDHTLPGELIAIGSAAGGAVAAYLAHPNSD